MASNSTHYKTLLLSELARRKKNNATYSLRAFARDLSVSPASLSQVLSGRREFSKRSAEKVSERLGLSPLQRKVFFSKNIGSSTNNEVDKTEYLRLQEDQFKLMSDWHYIAILALPLLKTHKANAKWIATRLGISEFEVKDAILTLQRLGLIAIKNGKIIRKTQPIQAGNNVQSSAIRKYHRQNLKLAEAALEEVETKKRLFSALTIAIHPEKLTIASELIQEFKERLSKIVDDPNASELYTLSIQFFPITKEAHK